jgi:hypothetical protein
MAINNIPAFPNCDKNGIIHPGMTLLDYYAAHAPAEPPKWWKPEMEKQIFHPLALKYHLATEEEKAWLGYYNDENDEWFDNPEQFPEYFKENEVPPNIPQHFKEKIARLVKEIEAANIAAHEWQEREKYERLVQWPFYYATQMLIRREAFLQNLTLLH